MTTIIRDRTMLSDRITKWARCCFQNSFYDCRALRRSADATAENAPYKIIEIRYRVNSDDFDAMFEVRLPCQ